MDQNEIDQIVESWKVVVVAAVVIVNLFEFVLVAAVKQPVDLAVEILESFLVLIQLLNYAKSKVFLPANLFLIKQFVQVLKNQSVIKLY